MKIKKEIKEILGVATEISDIIYSKDGLKKHIEKRGHLEVLPYLEKLDRIISAPDFVGVNPKEKTHSIEYVKKFDENILLAIKLNIKQQIFYIASMYSISDYKLESRLKSGRLKEVDNI